jgi:hypothetical protein
MSKSGNFEHPRVIEYVKSVFGSTHRKILVV